MRLVPDQTPEEITELFKNHFESIAPKAVKVKVTPHHGGYPYLTPIDFVGYRAANKAQTEAFGVESIPQRGGGSIPIVALFEEELKSKTILMGFGLETDNIHSPNEHFVLKNFELGMLSSVYFLEEFAK